MVGRPVETLLGDPSIEGRFFYTDDLSSVNFVRQSEKISSTLETLLLHAGRRGPAGHFHPIGIHP